MLLEMSNIAITCFSNREKEYIERNYKCEHWYASFILLPEVVEKWYSRLQLVFTTQASRAVQSSAYSLVAGKNQQQGDHT